jgi:hypothetical protein
MSRNALLRAMALVLGAAMCLALPAFARILTPDATPAATDRLTVVLADGWEFQGVTTTWYPEEGVLVVVRTDGARRTLRPEELAGLRDAAGRDVTRTILPPWAIERLGGAMPPAGPVTGPIAPGPIQPTPQPVPPPVENPDPDHDPLADWQEVGAPREDDAPARFRPPDPRVIFEVGAGYASPHDQHFADFDGGFGFEAVLRMQLAGPIYLAGGYLHQILRQPEYGYAVPCDLEDPYCGWFPNDGGDATIKGAWAGLSLISAAESPRPVRFYLEAGVGRFDTDDLPVWSFDDAYLGYRFGTGFFLPVGEHAVFDLGVRALHVKNLDFGYQNDDGDTMLGVHAGIGLLGF